MPWRCPLLACVVFFRALCSGLQRGPWLKASILPWNYPKSVRLTVFRKSYSSNILPFSLVQISLKVEYTRNRRPIYVRRPRSSIFRAVPAIIGSVNIFHRYSKLQLNDWCFVLPKGSGNFRCSLQCVDDYSADSIPGNAWGGREFNFCYSSRMNFCIFIFNCKGSLFW